jgi:hypothetical protein
MGSGNRSPTRKRGRIAKIRAKSAFRPPHSEFESFASLPQPKNRFGFLMPMIGVDFDNTIVCYDSLFFRAARDRGLIPDNFTPVKERIRNRLRELGKEDEWTELQAYVYGEYILDAEAFPGVYPFFELCRERNLGVSIISHKTRTPYQGPAFDLRSAAREWLRSRGFLDTDRTGLSEGDVYFEESKRDKLRRIAAVGCRLFVDDLPEFLGDPDFPVDVQRVLFEPAKRDGPPSDTVCCRSWSEITTLVFERFEK